MSSVFRNSAILARRGARLMQSRNYADEAMKLTFAAANKVFYDKAEVKQVDVPSFSGDFGILAAHVPTLGLSFVFFFSFVLHMKSDFAIKFVKFFFQLYSSPA